MTKIANQIAYKIKSPLSLNDFAVGTNNEDGVPGFAKGQTISIGLNEMRELFLAGLSPETGGTLKITETEIETLDTDVSTTVNAISPAYEVLAYEIVFFTIANRVYLLKKSNVTIGSGQTALTNDDFLVFPISVGPTGATGATGNGIASITLLSTVGLVKTYRITYTNASTFDFEVTDGEDVTMNNLQRTVTGNTTLADSDNNYTIIINNGSSAVNITVPTGLSSKFCVGLHQKGTGTVTIVESSTTVNNPTGKKIKGQYYNVYLEQIDATNEYLLGGDTKA